MFTTPQGADGRVVTKEQGRASIWTLFICMQPINILKNEKDGLHIRNKKGLSYRTLFRFFELIGNLPIMFCKVLVNGYPIIKIMDSKHHGTS